MCRTAGRRHFSPDDVDRIVSATSVRCLSCGAELYASTCNLFITEGGGIAKTRHTRIQMYFAERSLGIGGYHGLCVPHRLRCWQMPPRIGPQVISTEHELL